MNSRCWRIWFLYIEETKTSLYVFVHFDDHCKQSMTFVLFGTSTSPLSDSVVKDCIGTENGTAYDNITFEPLEPTDAVATGASDRGPYECFAPDSLLQFVQHQKDQGRLDILTPRRNPLPSDIEMQLFAKYPQLPQQDIMFGTTDNALDDVVAIRQSNGEYEFYHPSVLYDYIRRLYVTGVVAVGTPVQTPNGTTLPLDFEKTLVKRFPSLLNLVLCFCEKLNQAGKSKREGTVARLVVVHHRT